jgi:hypothetical protein
LKKLSVVVAPASLVIEDRRSPGQALIDIRGNITAGSLIDAASGPFSVPRAVLCR